MQRIIPMRLPLLLVTSSLLLTAATPSGFLAEQLRYQRVRDAHRTHASTLNALLANKGLRSTELNILLVAYKDEDILELHAKRSQDSAYAKLKTYPICARSGKLGPKWAQGDGQVPEGIYHIDRFNPQSQFHLSLGINYPNAADRRRSTHTKLGGDIFIHGACMTIGCLPMTNPGMEEIYLLAVHARNSGQSRIPVYIFPFRMNDQRMASYAKAHAGRSDVLAFWGRLQQEYFRWIREKR